jgi:hypothetical protein
MAIHPRVLARGTRLEAARGPRTVVYVPGLWGGWVEGELDGTRAVVQIRYTFAQVVVAVGAAPSRRPQVLVIDFDALTAVELVAFCGLREHGWTGTIIALGDVPGALVDQVGVACVLRTPIRDHALRDAIEDHRTTSVIPRIVTG